MRLSKKQRALALDLFGTDRLTRRQFSQLMDERKRAAEAAYDAANEVDLLDLAESHTTMTRSGNTRTGPCPMPACRASKDGFWVDIRTNTGGCHSCFWPRGVGSGPIGFIRALTGCEAWEARDQLVGKIDMAAPVTHQKRKREPKTTEAAKDFTVAMKAATEALRGSDGLACWGRRYLTGRGIKQETWERFGIGVVADYGNRGFVASPFHHLDSGNLCGIRYSNAKISAKGSKFSRGVFGLGSLLGLPVAFVVEGEVNGLSIWQVCDELGRSVDVVSVGSQGAFKSLASDLAKRLRGARLIVVWADKEEVGRAVSPIFAANGAMVSVIHSHNKLDANDLLKNGQLSWLLLSMLPKDDAGLAKADEEAAIDGDLLLLNIGYLIDELDGQARAKAIELYSSLEQAVIDNEIERAVSIHDKAKTLATASVWKTIKGMIEQEEREALRPTTQVAPATPEAMDELYEFLIDVGGLVDELEGEAQAQATKLYIELEQAIINNAIDKARSIHRRAKALITTRAWQKLKGMKEQERRNALFL